MWIVEVFDCIHIFSVSDVSDGGDTQETKLKLQHLLTDENIANAVEGSHRLVCVIVYSSPLFDVCFCAFERDLNLSCISKFKVLNPVLNPDSFQSENIFNSTYMQNLWFGVDFSN